VIATPDGELELLNTHLDASRPDTFRIQESRTLLAFADARRLAGARLFLGGDLNSTPESVPQQMVRATGLVDAWTSCAAGDGFTFPDGVPVKRIDYLYLPPGERCLAARVIDSRASDHRPLLVEVPARP
jgi:endonuclease/exonuclease/phosphatase (EEP) superfamily protein YafD